MIKAAEAVKATIVGLQPGDPDKAMEVLADVVRGEGCAVGKTFPNYLPMGAECEEAIREQCSTMLAVVDEWGDVIRSTDFQKVRL